MRKQNLNSFGKDIASLEELVLYKSYIMRVTYLLGGLVISFDTVWKHINNEIQLFNDWYYLLIVIVLFVNVIYQIVSLIINKPVLIISQVGLVYKKQLLEWKRIKDLEITQGALGSFDLIITKKSGVIDKLDVTYLSKAPAAIEELVYTYWSAYLQKEAI